MSDKGMKRKNVSSLKEKRAAVEELQRQSMSSGNKAFERLAATMVDPRSHSPVVFPGPVAQRCGAAKFPLVVNLTGRSDWTIVAQPTLDAPLKVSATAVTLESGTNYYGEAFTSDSTDLREFYVQDGCYNLSSIQTGLVALPLTSAAGATFQLHVSYEYINEPVTFTFVALIAGVWTDIATSTVLGFGIAERVLSAIVYPNTATHWTIRFNKNSPAGIGEPTGKFQWRLNHSAGTSTCNGANLESALIEHNPAWEALKQASDSMRIVAMDCLVTYEGSTLDNQGSIAVCNSDLAMQFTGSTYETVASHPFDKYRGRLAAAGDSPGGGHWHYVPNDVRQLLLAETDDFQPNTPRGIFGIAGMDATQPIRVEVNVIVNFYSDDPSYSMKIRPPLDNFLHLLWEIRKAIPLVSSNDKHLIIKAAQGARDIVRTGANFARAHPAEMAKLLSLLSMLI